MSTQLEQVQQEIESLHAFFCEWFGGRMPQAQFHAQFMQRFDPGLVFIPPAGHYFGLNDLGEAVRKGYGSNPDFRVQIRNVRVLREMDGFVLATYEEWQRNALASTPPDNGRLATVLFEMGEPLRWHHIHETWLPAAIMEAGPYDF